jgi:hypothetical protein
MQTIDSDDELQHEKSMNIFGGKRSNISQSSRSKNKVAKTANKQMLGKIDTVDFKLFPKYTMRVSAPTIPQISEVDSMHQSVRHNS